MPRRVPLAGGENDNDAEHNEEAGIALACDKLLQEQRSDDTCPYEAALA